jgi:hypothetical protein
MRPAGSWTKRATTAWPVSVVCWVRAVAITVSAIVCAVLTPRLARTAISRRRPLAAGRGLVAGEQVSAPRCLDKPKAGFGRPPGPRGSASWAASMGGAVFARLGADARD